MNAEIVIDKKRIIQGKGHGRRGAYSGELVFTTAMMGYMEAITDPSYARQMLVFAYPLIGNYGVDTKWTESRFVYPSAIIVHELDPRLEQFLLSREVGVMSGVDTRRIVHYIRNHGAVPAVLKINNSNKQIEIHRKTNTQIQTFKGKIKKHIALIDYGYKKSILDELLKRNYSVTVFPKQSSYEDILKIHPSGIILSNGPGDPTDFHSEIQTVQKLMQQNIPILGICLGHQLLALATNSKTYKMKYGHRGLNQPIIGMNSKRSFITSQNHEYAVQKDSLSSEWNIWFENLIDKTVEGLAHKKKNIFSVQFHPEAHPGPHDTNFIFDFFLKHL